ncbi:MAG: 3-hydroxyanthranilate 3,4-dioxygenase [Anaerolineae bacterium]|nr:3-hydroxyanthranilate 3,4-dioxygenase [Phycisphaerae bacterium]
MSPTTDTKTLPPIDLMKWIEQHRHEMKPPVSNKYLYDGEDFFVMIINGPNARNDFHVTNSEEFFYQLKGDIVVRIVEDGKIKDVIVREGNTFFVPGNVPHSPTRPPGTLGLVIERRRPPGEMEHLQFYCDNCDQLVYDLEFDCKDIVKHFAQAMEDFWADPEASTCKNCGTRVTKPKPIKRIQFEPAVKIERE